ncbi:PDR/VanB family oxidoreductase [Amycolatopsis acidiphila]|uniref:Oxidoreductase n=1 Tax=Amycolatopsis acidiphila TaxID=715473 RepID=A0A558AL39_9PSEU|nr:PDR/VanB family oxidoreductase [Amycolatopsis acidiphila]TVT24970.1 oxidoreductase [Amycolatopsis acidiphila]UIJ57526.1 PDR/VanB family oxidoreductase [Amycolatopsis acidiphila]GHG89286.1 ferredoxin [Amycolatopsis acidiphila]
MSADEARRVLVTQARREADGVVSLTLSDPDGRELPAWEPGAHVDLVLPSGAVRQYSLCGHADDRYSYTVAVLRETGGRGGSAEVHDTGLVGRELTIRGPRNHFRLVDAPGYVLLAGGIGITPILSMARRLAAGPAPWLLCYGGRSAASMAFTGELAALSRGRVEFYPEDEAGRLPLERILADLVPRTAVYVCGPPGLIAAVQDCAGKLFPEQDLHLERFTAAPDAQPRADGDAFEVELARTGEVLEVPGDRSILDVVRDARPDILSSCEEGFCGTCETKVLAGDPEHRDTILTEADRERGATMMICVGRSRSPRLVLDL